MVGDAILEVTGAYRINYFMGGNSEPVLHAHIVPRYLSEPDVFRKGGPWSYPDSFKESNSFDFERDRSLIGEIGLAIQKRL